MIDVLRRRNGKDLIQLLKRERLGLRQTEITKDPAKKVPRRVPAKGTGGSERFIERRPGQRDDEVETPRCGCCEGHADVSDVEGLALSVDRDDSN